MTSTNKCFTSLLIPVDDIILNNGVTIIRSMGDAMEVRRTSTSEVGTTRSQ